MNTHARRVQLAAGYILHHQPYRDTSRILEVLTRDAGRLSLFARGQLRRLPLPSSELGAVIMQHQLHGALARHSRKLRRAPTCRNQTHDRPTD